MVNLSIVPYTGPSFVDLAGITKILLDLAPGVRQFLRAEMAGIEEVVYELAHSVPSLGSKAAISSDVYAHFVECNENIGKIRALRSIIDKIAEVLEESEAYYVHEREVDISIMADAVRSTIRRRDESIRAAFERILKYNAQNAEKSLKTRRKKAQAAAQAEGPEKPGQAADPPAKNIEDPKPDSVSTP